MRLLLTGGSGQVGTAVRRAAWLGWEQLAPTSAEMDVADADAVEACVARYRPQVVINAAAYTAVDRAQVDEEGARRVNFQGAANVAAACARHAAHLIHLSTDYVFDGTKPTPYREDDATNPLNVYGETKQRGESAVEETHGDSLILRVSWVFSATGTNFVKKILALAETRDELQVVDDQWGTPCPARSIADVLEACLRRHSEGTPLRGLHHFATRPVTNWLSFAGLIVDEGLRAGLLSRRPSFRGISAREFGAGARRPENSVLDSTRLSQALGVDAPDWRPELRVVVEELARASADSR